MGEKTLTALTITDLWREYKRNFVDYWQECDIAVKEFKRRFIELSLEAERTELVGCVGYERSINRRDYRNGYWRRWITLKDGRLEVRMPRVRSGGYKSQIIPRYKQRISEVDRALMRIFLYGASTRLTGEALKPLIGEGVSAQTISNITRSLDEEVKRFHTRKVRDEYLYLILDAVVVKMRTGFGSKKKAVLVAYGITVQGRRQIIDFMVVSHEGENKWVGFLQGLNIRGLSGEALGLIVTDGNRGLENAVDLVYPFVRRQRCWAHKLRNVANYLKKKDIDRCINEARGIYEAEGREEAIRVYRGWVKEWGSIYPRAVRCIEKDLEELLNVYYCPKEMRKKLRTTNVIERAFREVRRRVRPISCFNNTQSIERIIYAVISHLNDQWRKKPLKEFTQNS
jgi:putative transposase